jgi:hypothetical protein
MQVWDLSVAPHSTRVQRLLATSTPQSTAQCVAHVPISHVGQFRTAYRQFGGLWRDAVEKGFPTGRVQAYTLQWGHPGRLHEGERCAMAPTADDCVFAPHIVQSRQGANRIEALHRSLF